MRSWPWPGITAKPPAAACVGPRARPLARPGPAGLGAGRLPPCVPELLDRLLAFGALPLTPDTTAALRRVSAASLKRLLAPIHATRPLRGRGTTRAAPVSPASPGRRFSCRA